MLRFLRAYGKNLHLLPPWLSALLLIGGMLLPATLPAGYESLRENSPFVPEGFVDPSQRRPPPPPPRQRQNDPLDRLELRSIWVFEGVPSFSIYDAVNDRSYWLRENETREGFTITRFNARADSVTVRYEGRTRDLPLRSSQVETSAEEPETSSGEETGPGGSQAPRRGAPPSVSPEERERLLRERAEELRQRQVVRRRIITPESSESSGNE